MTTAMLVMASVAILIALPDFASSNFGPSFGDDSLGWLAEAESWGNEAQGYQGLEDSTDFEFRGGTSIDDQLWKRGESVPPSETHNYASHPRLGDYSDTSSFVDPSVFDYHVSFSSGANGIGMTLEERDMKLYVASMADSQPAELSGLIQLGDQLIAISGEPANNLTPRDAMERIDSFQETGWFRLKFRPTPLERRTKRELYDHNVTVQLLEGGGIRLGMVLSTGLKVISILPGQILNDGGVKVGDQLIAIGEEVMTGRSIVDVAERLSSLSGAIVLRFRLPLSERKHVKKKSSSVFGLSNTRKSTYQVEFRTLQDLGLEISDSMVVTGFRASPRDGGIAPAEQSGEISVGDTVLAVNDAAATDAQTLRYLLGQKTHEEVLRCRGNKVTRYCAVERVHPTSNIRVIRFQTSAIQRRNVREHLGLSGKNSNDSLRAEKGFHLPSSVDMSSHDNIPRQSMYSVTRANKRVSLDTKGDKQGALKLVLTPSGRHEAVFRAPRGIAMTKTYSADFSSALFGGALWCGDHRLVVASPISACQALTDEDNLRDSYLVVRRGECFFTSKAINAQYAGAAGIIVIDREDPMISRADDHNSHSVSALLPLRMPASTEDGHLVKIPAVMISHQAGEMLLRDIEKSMRSGVPLFLKLMPENPRKNQCGGFGGADLAYETTRSGVRKLEPPFRTEQAGGRLVIKQNDTLLSDLEFATAYFSGSFGSEIKSRHLLTLARPRNGCSDSTNKKIPKGAVVIAERGECALIDKARLAQKMGASAIIIVNDRPCELERMQSWMTLYQPGRSKSTNIRIPAILVSKHAGRKVMLALQHYSIYNSLMVDSDTPVQRQRGNEGNFWAHLQLNSSHLEHWESLLHVKSPSAWPAHKSARDDLYAQLAFVHHPDKATGHIDRYQCLVRIKDDVERYHLQNKVVHGKG